MSSYFTAKAAGYVDYNGSFDVAEGDVNAASLYTVVVTAGTEDVTTLAVEADGVMSQNTETVNIASGSSVTFAAVLNKIATTVKAVVNGVTID